MTGIITPDREAVIRLDVQDADGKAATVEIVLDTDFLTLPPAQIAPLRLTLSGSTRVTLANDSTAFLDTYSAADGGALFANVHALRL